MEAFASIAHCGHLTFALDCVGLWPNILVPQKKQDYHFFLCERGCDIKAGLFFANFTAPPLIKADISNCALKMMGASITANPEHHAGLLLCPVFAYKQGNLFGEEFALLKVLSNSGCMVEAGFQLIFDIKSKTEP